MLQTDDNLAALAKAWASEQSVMGCAHLCECVLKAMATGGLGGRRLSTRMSGGGTHLLHFNTGSGCWCPPSVRTRARAPQGVGGGKVSQPHFRLLHASLALKFLGTFLNLLVDFCSLFVHISIRLA